MDDLVGLATDGASFDPATDPTLSSSGSGFLTNLGNTLTGVFGTWADTTIKVGAQKSLLQAQSTALANQAGVQGYLASVQGSLSSQKFNQLIWLAMIAAVIIVVINSKKAS